MSKTPGKKQGKNPTAPRASRASSARTRLKLVAAAVKEFNQHGYHGTDTNKIARRAGFSPQTFYRRFGDKTAIFLAVYRLWEEQERDMLAKLIAANATASELVEAAVAHHRAHRIFRRSLRTLSYEDTQVRAARAQSRLRQIESIKLWIRPSRIATADIAAILLQMERLSDALAEGEFGDLNVDEKVAFSALVQLQSSLHG